MKKLLFALSCVLIIAMTTGCFGNSPVDSDMTDSSASSENTSDIKISYFRADWPHYDSVQTLVSASDNVFEGKLTNIYFDIVDLKTGYSASKNSEASDLYLYTVYEIDVNTSYKGVNADKICIKVIGGIAGYKEMEQYAKMNEYDLYKDEVGLLVLEQVEPLTLGETYLFLTCGPSGPYHNIVSDTQFAYNVSGADQTSPFTFNEIKFYVIGTDVEKTHNSSAI